MSYYTAETRKSNPYLREIDRTNKILDDDLIEIDNRVTIIETGENSEIVTNELHKYNSYFPPEMVAYYDFSDEYDITKDIISGHSGTTHGAEQFIDSERKYTAHFDRLNNIVDYLPYTNNKIIDISNVSVMQSSPSYTISIWYKTKDVTTYHTAVAFSNDSSDTRNDFSILQNTTDARLVMFTGGTKVLDIKIPNNVVNTWTHLVVSSSPTGNTFYVNGVKLTAYTTGSNTVPINLSSYNRCTLGALAYGPERRIALDGYLSDFSFWNKVLTDEEVTSLFNDDYGSLVFILAGQSNMVSYSLNDENDADYTDLDYSLQDGRVFQYDTASNIDYDGSQNEILGSSIIQATKNLRHPNPSKDAEKTAIWKTFCDDLIQSGNIPYRKKILLVPVAANGTHFLTSWSPTQPRYKATVLATNDAMLTNPWNTLSGFLWNQGESSAANYDLSYNLHFLGMLAGYQTEITGFKNDLPIIFAEIAGNAFDQYVADNGTKMKQFVNAKFVELEAENSNMYLVKTLGKYHLTVDDTHYNSESLRGLGHDYYDGFCAITGLPPFKENKKSIVINTKNDIRSVGINHELYLKPSNIYTNYPLDGCFNHKWIVTSSDAAVVAAEFNFLKVGKIVNLTLNGLLSASIVSGTSPLVFTGLPVEFRPKIDNLKYAITGRKDITLPNEISLFTVTMNTAGLLHINNTGASTFFTNGNTINVYPFSISYITE